MECLLWRGLAIVKIKNFCIDYLSYTRYHKCVMVNEKLESTVQIAVALAKFTYT